MKDVTEFIVKVTNLLEAEARAAYDVVHADTRRMRDSVAGLGVGLLTAAGGGIIILIGVLFWLGAIYFAVREVAGQAWGAVAAGGAGLLIGVGCVLQARRMLSS
ncbi:MAG: hypothetical protein SFY69_13150 [Planctomycetota bacterium]|nr:hypothetical protein [Planctomycetota bacterium]